MKYLDQDGKKILLGGQLGRGASATIFKDQRNSNRAIKIYNPAHLEKEPKLQKCLLKLMELSAQADFEIPLGGKMRSIGAFPRGLVTDEDKNLVGFIMDSFDGVNLTEIIYAKNATTAFYKYSVKGNAYQSQDHYNGWLDSFLYSNQGLRNRFILVYTLAQCYCKLNEIRAKSSCRRFELECLNFDCKPDNVLVRLENDQKSGKKLIIPFLLDLDNITLKTNLGSLGPSSPNVTPEYMAPEGPTSVYFDYYSIAIIFYQILIGIHPFEGIQGDSRFRDGTERSFFMKNRCFPGGQNRKYIRCSQEHQRFDKMPKSLRTLFCRALDAQNLSDRPTPREWQITMEAVLTDQALDFSTMFNLPVQAQKTSPLMAPRTPPDLSLPIFNTNIAQLLNSTRNKMSAIFS